MMWSTGRRRCLCSQPAVALRPPANASRRPALRPELARPRLAGCPVSQDCNALGVCVPKCGAQIACTASPGSLAGTCLAGECTPTGCNADSTLCNADCQASGGRQRPLLPGAGAGDHLCRGIQCRCGREATPFPLPPNRRAKPARGGAWTTPRAACAPASLAHALRARVSAPPPFSSTWCAAVMWMVALTATPRAVPACSVVACPQLSAALAKRGTGLPPRTAACSPTSGAPASCHLPRRPTTIQAAHLWHCQCPIGVTLTLSWATHFFSDTTTQARIFSPHSPIH